MNDLIQMVAVVAVVLFAIYQLSKGSGPAAKAAAVVVAGLAPVYDKVLAFIQGLIG